MTGGAYQPYRPARRPGGRPATKPRYRVLVHRRFAETWAALPERVGLASAQQFYDHVAHAPGRPAEINRTGILRGRAEQARVHLDFHTDDLAAEVARLEKLGAQREQRVQDWYVMRDPAGLLFCVVPVQPGSLDETNARRWT